MGLTRKLEKHGRFMIDTAPVIYFIEEHATYGPITEELFRWIRVHKEIHAPVHQKRVELGALRHDRYRQGCWKRP